MKQMKKARKVSAGVFLGLGAVLALIAMSLGGPVRTVAADDSSRQRNPAQYPAQYPVQHATLSCGIAGNCLPNAHGDVTVVSLGPVEQMDVDVEGLPPNTEFDFFVIQIPNAPFGLAWYQGDIETNNLGRGSPAFRGALQHRDIHSSAAPRGPGSSPSCTINLRSRMRQRTRRPSQSTRSISAYGLVRPRPPCGRLSRRSNPLQR